MSSDLCVYCHLPHNQQHFEKLSSSKHCWSLRDTESVDHVCSHLRERCSFLWVPPTRMRKQTDAQL